LRFWRGSDQMRRFAPAIVAVAGAVLAGGCGAASSVVPVAASSCGSIVFHGSGKPDYLIVSDLPLRAPPGAQQQVAGIEFVLRQRRYRAGKFAIGYQSCDDSSAASAGRELARCAANAK